MVIVLICETWHIQNKKLGIIFTVICDGFQTLCVGIHIWILDKVILIEMASEFETSSWTLTLTQLISERKRGEWEVCQCMLPLIAVELEFS